MDPAVAVTKQATGAAPVATTPGTKDAVAKRTVVTDRDDEVTAEPLRRSRVEMTKVELWSVLKVSLCFYLAGLAILIIAGLVVWLLLDASGGIHKFESFMGDIMSAKDYKLVAPQILLGSVLVGLVLVALMTIVTVIAAALYNVFADLVGGVEVTLVEAN
ncbi:MAG: DUF3566 domain-containing protein [Acidimicrobiia bacterium]